jgi:elongation factor Ts
LIAVTVSAKEVQALRQLTGAGMMDAKKALEACGGNQEEALKWLRERGLASAAKRADREAGDGAVALGSAPGAAAIVELKCETDFVAKSDAFVNLVGDLAEAVAVGGEGAIADFKDQIDDLAVTLKENIQLGRVVRFEIPPGHLVGSYLHVQNERGVNAVLVETEGADEAKAHDIAVHIAFARPDYLSRDEVPAEVVEEERATLEQLSRNEGKPEAALPKIVEGRLAGWFKEHCLLEQPYVRDEKITVGAFVSPAKLVRFAQVVVGT